MKLSDLRQSAGYSVIQVAKELNVSIQSVYRYEQGERKLSLEQVLELSKLFDCSAEEIIKSQINSNQSDR